jgi:hypothetical protein
LFETTVPVFRERRVGVAEAGEPGVGVVLMELLSASCSDYFFLLFLAGADLLFAGAAFLPEAPEEDFFLEGECPLLGATAVFFLWAAARFFAPLPEAAA